MKNRVIELERFIAACMILLFHLNVAEGGWIFVEFFFLLTGYFSMRHLAKRKETIQQESAWYPLTYTWKKYLKFFPYTSVGIITMWIGQAVTWNLAGKDLIKWLLYLPANLLLIAGSGMQPYGTPFVDGIMMPRMINGHLWQLCSLIIVLPLVLFILIHGKKTKPFFISLVPVVLYGFLIMKDGVVGGWHHDKFAFIMCNVRAMAGLLLGAGTWYLSQWWQKRNYTAFGKLLLTAVEILGFATVVAIASVTQLPYDALEIGLMVLSISLTTSGVTYTTKWDFPVLEYLGRLGLPMYCIQMWILRQDRVYIKSDSAIVPFVLTILASIVLELLVSGGRKLYRKHRDSLKKLIVE